MKTAFLIAGLAVLLLLLFSQTKGRDCEAAGGISTFVHEVGTMCLTPDGRVIP